MINIIDYGMGNVGSIKNMMNKIQNCTAEICTSPENLYKSDGIILPGVGTYDSGVQMLKNKGFFEVVKDIVIKQKKPILGICLGMQLLGNQSEEGKEEGFCFIDFECRKFVLDTTQFRVPHMGWNYAFVKNESKITKDIGLDSRYYFVHSYYAVCKEEKNVMMYSKYGHEFVAAVCKDNIYGVQFHPEKSHKYGLLLLKNFAEVCQNVS